MTEEKKQEDDNSKPKKPKKPKKLEKPEKPEKPEKIAVVKALATLQVIIDNKVFLIERDEGFNMSAKEAAELVENGLAVVIHE
ncbi:MAG: hypothetical protein V6Z82_01030 [Flavobacteriales bacterium]